MSERSKELLRKSSCGINVSIRRDAKKKIRIYPYVEVRGSNHVDLEQLKLELLNLSVGSTVRPKFLRIQGIQNCDLITPYIKPPSWWKKAMEKFLNKEHCQRDGIQEILQLRPNTRSDRTSDDEIVQLLMDFE